MPHHFYNDDKIDRKPTVTNPTFTEGAANPYTMDTITVISCFSLLSCSASARPTLPQPAIIIFILSLYPPVSYSDVSNITLTE